RDLDASGIRLVVLNIIAASYRIDEIAHLEQGKVMIELVGGCARGQGDKLARALHAFEQRSHVCKGGHLRQIFLAIPSALHLDDTTQSARAERSSCRIDRYRWQLRQRHKQ